MEKARRAKGKNKNKRSTRSRMISFLMMIVFLILFIYSGIKIINYIINNNRSKKVTTETLEHVKVIGENRYEIDFEVLKEKNQDTVAFLKIKVQGMDYKYIVVKGNDNSYYLNHNFYKENSVFGWIFADYRNKFDGTDKNIIIYGHNMKNGTMFAPLKNVLKEEWYKNEDNRYLTFITEKEDSKYEVFSVYQIEDEDYYIKTSFTDTEFNDFINTIKARSVYDFNVDVSDNDNIITLSTCADNTKYRIVLHAKKITEERGEDNV